MKKRFSDEQIISILREAEAGVPARDSQAYFRCHVLHRRSMVWRCLKLSA
jgi:hypothetical protein